MITLCTLLKRYAEKYGCPLSLEGSGERDPVLTEISSDSRQIASGGLFCCIRGENADGHDFAPSALERGASVLLTDHILPLDVPQIVSRNVRRDMGRLADILYGEPSGKLLLLAATGTNGKSTTVWMLRYLLESLGIRTGLFGTILYSDGVHEREADRTTPESWEIQRELAAMVENGCGACVMEASSHGLILDRLEGCRFDGAVFTNLSEEHLDYHGTLEEYFQAKTRLFSSLMKPRWQGAANGDDLWGRRIQSLYTENILSFGLDADTLDIRGEGVALSIAGSEFSLVTSPKEGKVPLFLPIPGRFNVYNALGALTLLGFFFPDQKKELADAMKFMVQVPGRLEKYFFSNGVTVIIDFAHTPTALKNVLGELQTMCSGTLVSLFGHGGERFEPNRPALGRIAASLAQKVIITSDNPRREDPQRIAGQILEGVLSESRPVDVRVILDRKTAVRTALDEAQSGDVVVLSGKGPEKYIVIGGERIPYSDRGEVLSWAEDSGVTEI